MTDTIPASVLRKLNKIIAELPGKDGWHKGYGEWWSECACILYDQQHSLEDIRDLLQRMYNEVKAEYGD